MTAPPDDRCGYTWPDTYEVGDAPDAQSCCWRETAPGSPRCLLHANPESVDAGPEAVVDALDRPDAGAPILDGLDLSGVEFGYHTPDATADANDGPQVLDMMSMDREDLLESDLLDRLFENPDEIRARFEDIDDLDALGDDSLTPVHPFEGASLRGSDLSGANGWQTSFVGADLRDADLSDAEFRGADFSGACLVGANLSGAAIDETGFTGARLVDADFSNAELETVDFTDADLKFADFSEAMLKSADLEHADFRDADLSDTYFSFVDVNGADLGYADLSDASF